MEVLRRSDGRAIRLCLFTLLFPASVLAGCDAREIIAAVREIRELREKVRLGAVAETTELHQIRELHEREKARLGAVVEATEQAEARLAVAERKARDAECRAEVLKVEAEASTVAAECAAAHTEASQCRSNVAKAQADSTFFGCLFGIGAALITGGAAGPMAMLGCAGGRLAADSDEICGMPSCDPSQDAGWREVVAQRGAPVPMCGGSIGIKVRDHSAVGLPVQDLVPGGDAYRMGIRAGDVLLAVHGTRVYDLPTLRDALARVPMKGPIDVAFVRERAPRRLRGVHSQEKLGIMAGETIEVPHGRVVIDAVAPGSPADNAGLRQGDALHSIDGHTILESEDVRRKIQLREAGATVRVIYYRAGLEKQALVVLGARIEPHEI